MKRTYITPSLQALAMLSSSTLLLGSVEIKTDGNEQAGSEDEVGTNEKQGFAGSRLWED